MLRATISILPLVLLGVTFGISAPGRSLAQTAVDCAEIKDDTKRLTCYDLIHRKTSEVTSSQKSEWDRIEEKSKIDDSRTVFLSVSSKKEISDGYGRNGPAYLNIVCREGSTHFYVTMAGNFLSSTGGYGDVTTRIDNLKAETREWDESTDNKALGLWQGSGISMIKKLFKHNTLLVRITPFNESAQTVEFPITGLEEEIKPLRAACKW